MVQQMGAPVADSSFLSSGQRRLFEKAALEQKSEGKEGAA